MITKRRRRCISAAVIVAGVLAAFTGVPALCFAEGTAAKMQLVKTEGEVDVSSSSGKSLTLIDDMRLYNGYQVDTMEKSYAWVELDSKKLAKLDEASEASIRKSGKKLEILLNSGNVFFNITEPLKEDESLNIRTSTMVAGIRGTSGWVEVTDDNNVRVTVLEGSVEVSVTDPVSAQVKSDTVSSGETAVCTVYAQTAEGGDTCGIVRENYTKEEIKGFVLEEVLADASLAEKIVEKGGLDLRDLTEEETKTRLKEDEEKIHEKLAKVETALEEQAALETHVSTEPAQMNSEEKPSAEEKPKENTAAPVNTPPLPKKNDETTDPKVSGQSELPGTSGGSGNSDTAKPAPTPAPTPVPAPAPAPNPPSRQVTFNAQGGSGLAAQTVTDGSGVSEPSTARAGYTFTGWYTDAACTNRYAFGTPVTGDLTLYAGWAAQNYTVTFDARGGSGPAAQTIPYGGVVVEPSAGTRGAGYTFTGWYTDAACTNRYAFGAPVAGNLVLYAGWELQNCTVALELYEGESRKVPVPYGSAVNPPEFAFDGFVFAGWYADAGRTVRYDLATAVTGDLTLYANWEIRGCTVTFDAQGGSSPSADRTPYGGKVREPSTTRAGYRFTGWYTDAGCTNKYDFNARVEEDFILYAGWSAE